MILIEPVVLYYTKDYTITILVFILNLKSFFKSDINTIQLLRLQLYLINFINSVVRINISQVEEGWNQYGG